ncbi:MAG TPA: prenyltransferase/squalene oxidase repeat-containing protein [Pirellulales bacterium]|jgi:squalene-hopene/tetraprenyl-beta-curcumene cyclase|nr:prenyltransferase/squalene oxidase repeat-containing protein [Pirellulales bacterium]
MRFRLHSSFACRVLSAACCASLVAGLISTLVYGEEGAKAASSSQGRLSEQVVGKAIEFLRQKGQAEDGSFSKQSGPAVTALVATAVLRHGRSPDDPLVAKALDYVKKFVHEDGGIYDEGSKVQNYETSLGLMCFVEANRDGRYDKLIKNAEKFLKDLQWDGKEGHDESSFNYGGAGYGGHKRPDLSNTTFFLDALKAAGNGPDDEAVKKALVFVSRCQNLESDHNTTPFPAKNPDGGFYYTPAAGGNSQAGETDEGGLRSYASMTYAGLKSMIFAGVGPDDPRVKAAVSWLQKHYDLDSNPGMGDAGLYYYYQTFAKALDAFGHDTFEDADGKKHDWRQELIAELAGRQQADGSWINSNSRWREGDPNLVTGYALLALAYCRK